MAREILFLLCIVVVLVAVNTVRRLVTKPAQGKQTPATGGSAAGFLRDFCVFRRMIAPVIIQAFFWLGVIACVVAGIVVVSQGPFERERDDVTVGILLMTLGPFAIRLFCEFVILFFRINETLTEIKNQVIALRSQVGKRAPRSGFPPNVQP